MSAREPARCVGLYQLAPKMQGAVVDFLAAAAVALPDSAPVVYESMRSSERQAWCHARGVSNARNALYSWHGYGLAVDVIHPRLLWDAPRAWWDRVGALGEAHGLTWGGRWKTLVDFPHFQWGRCRVSPSSRARELYAAYGLAAVWREVGAL